MVRAVRPLLLWVAAGTLAGGCGWDFGSWPDGTPPPEPPRAQIYADECRTQLAAGDYEMAKLAAYNVVKGSMLADEHPSVDQAVFCYTTANTLYRISDVTKNIDSQLGLVAGLLGGGNAISISPQGIQKLADDYVNGRLDPQSAGAIGVFLDAYLGPLQALLEENALLLEYIIQRNRFNWQIDALPIKIADRKVADAGGRYDLGEVQVLYAFTRGLLGAIYLIQSQEYAISLEIVQYGLQANLDNPLLHLSDNPVRALSNAYAVLLATSPKFLLLDPSVGKPKMKAAGESFALMFDALLKAITAMQERSAALQPEHLIEFNTDEGRNFFVLHVHFENWTPLVDLRKFDGMAVPLRADVVAALANIAEDFAGAKGVNTNLQRDVLPIVAMAGAVLLNSGAFDAILELAVDDADQSVQETVDKTLQVLADNPDLLLAALVAAVPVEIELDFGYFFAHPVGLRDVLPAWVHPDIAQTKDTAYYQAFTTSSLVYSFECADASDPLVTGDLLCASAVDGAHFKQLDGSPYEFWAAPGVTWSSPDVRWENQPVNNFGTLWDAHAPIANDGLPSKFPYLGWKDPTFGGLLYLDVTAINGKGLITAGTGLKKADLQSLNATIASIVATVESFF